MRIDYDRPLQFTSKKQNCKADIALQAISTKETRTIICFRSAHYKGARWMPRHYVTMKDVATCEKLRRGGKQPVTRRCPNGETRPA